MYAAVLWILALVREYPAISTPIIGALIGLILKPRSPEQYARIAARRPIWLWIRIAAILQLIPTLFPDLQKAPGVILKVIMGVKDEDKKPKP